MADPATTLHLIPLKWMSICLVEGNKYTTLTSFINTEDEIHLLLAFLSSADLSFLTACFHRYPSKSIYSPFITSFWTSHFLLSFALFQ